MQISIGSPKHCTRGQFHTVNLVYPDSRSLHSFHGAINESDFESTPHANHQSNNNTLKTIVYMRIQYPNILFPLTSVRLTLCLFIQFLIFFIPSWRWRWWSDFWTSDPSQWRYTFGRIRRPYGRRSEFCSCRKPRGWRNAPIIFCSNAPFFRRCATSSGRRRNGNTYRALSTCLGRFFTYFG